MSTKCFLLLLLLLLLFLFFFFFAEYLLQPFSKMRHSDPASCVWVVSRWRALQWGWVKIRVRLGKCFSFFGKFLTSLWRYDQVTTIHNNYMGPWVSALSFGRERQTRMVILDVVIASACGCSYWFGVSTCAAHLKSVSSSRVLVLRRFSGI